MNKCCGSHLHGDGEENMCLCFHDRYFCTRPKGHKGAHIACGTFDHNLKTWIGNGSFSDFIAAKTEWSLATFGTIAERGPQGPLKHLKKEIEEILAAPTDLLEYVDGIFLIFDAAMRAGFTYEQILEGCWRKLEINKARQWSKPSADEPVFHVKRTKSQLP